MKPLYIGNVKIDVPVILAPMAGVTSTSFRLLCREMGCGMVCTEMVSAKAITYRNKKTEQLLFTVPEERPVSVQLFGSDPETLSEAARMIDDLPFDILDLNMGCPVPKITRNGDGSALLMDPEKAGRIMESMVKASSHPVTVKIRKGFDEDHVNAVEIARIAEQAGVSAIAVHGRTSRQFYTGKADWNIIRQVKEAVQIPVIGNGDIFRPEDAQRMMKETGCDAIMAARGARGNPWLFRDILDYAETGTYRGKPEAPEVAAMILRHAEKNVQYKGEFTGMREMRKQLAWYTAGLPHSVQIRRRVNEISDLSSLRRLLADWLSSY